MRYLRQLAVRTTSNILTTGTHQGSGSSGSRIYYLGFQELRKYLKMEGGGKQVNEVIWIYHRNWNIRWMEQKVKNHMRD